jgi:4,5-dihydroxyphthalate decarboxylase
MSKLSITLASDRYDFLRPLVDKEIVPEGIDLRIIEVVPTAGLAAARHRRMYQFGEYDAAEFALAGHITAVARGELLHRAIPCFPRRLFPHKFVIVRTDRGISTPADLAGRRIGIVNWENTLQLPLRRALVEQYGLPKDAIRWVVSNKGVLGVQEVPGFDVELDASGRSLEELVLSGDLDGVVLPYIMRAVVDSDPRVRCLFPDAEREERKYFQMTGQFPLMHDILLKESVLEQNPWVAHSLVDALKASRLRYSQWMEQPANLMFAWGREQLLKEREILGQSQWAEGFRAMRDQVQMMCDLAYDQGVVSRRVSPEELFVPSTLDS